jgi:all-trans-retinol 13,14-reductase
MTPAAVRRTKVPPVSSPLMDRRTAVHVLVRSTCALAAAPALASACTALRRTEVPGNQPSVLQRERRTLVIGSGLTGLASAALLTKAGYPVTVLEQHPELVGGHAREIREDGLSFSAGPQYVWNFGPDEVGHRVLEHLGLADRPGFRLMERDGFERFFSTDEEPFDVPMGLLAYRDALSERLPQDAKRLRKFFDVVEDLFASSRVIHDEGSYLGGGRAMFRALLRTRRLSLGQKWRAAEMSDRTLGELLSHCRLSRRARQLLFGNAGIFAETPESLSAVAYAGAIGYYHQGAYVPERGFQVLVDGLVAAIRSAGGEVLVGKKATQLSCANGLATEAICADGSRYPCNVVISNLSPRATCALVPRCAQSSLTYGPASPLLGAYVSLEPVPSVTDAIRRRNLWWRDSSVPLDFLRPDMASPPAFLYVSSPTANGYGQAPTDADRIGLVLFAPANTSQEREVVATGPDAYREFRTRITDALGGALARVLPETAGRTRAVRLFTPLDTEGEVAAEGGGAYGRRLTPRSLLAAPPIPAHPANVHFASASVGMPGVATALNTAALLFRQLTGQIV